MTVIPGSDIISFARGVPSPDMFPLDLLAECARQAVADDGRVALNYGPPEGYAPLRQWLGERHQVGAERILLMPGSLIGLNFLAQSLAGGGRRAVVEAPTYDRTLDVLATAGADVVAVERSDRGLDLARLRALAAAEPRPALLYVLPTFHNPTGRTLTLSQREELVELVLEHELLVVEDDPYGLVRIDGEALPTVCELLRARGGDPLAIYCSSFSKSVAPGLRVGYLVLPQHLVAPLRALALRTYVSPPILPEAQLFAFLHGGHLEPHLADLGKFLCARRDALVDGLATGLPEGAAWTRPDGGYFLWLDLPGGLDAGALHERAGEAGVAFVPGAGFFAEREQGRSAARLSFSYPGVDEITQGARRLTQLVRKALS